MGVMDRLVLSDAAWERMAPLIIGDQKRSTGHDDVSSQALVGAGAKVRVIPEGESWPVKEVKSVLKKG